MSTKIYGSVGDDSFTNLEGDFSYDGLRGKDTFYLNANFNDQIYKTIFCITNLILSYSSYDEDFLTLSNIEELVFLDATVVLDTGV